MRNTRWSSVTKPGTIRQFTRTDKSLKLRVISGAILFTASENDPTPSFSFQLYWYIEN